MKIAIIGAGFSGISAAAYAARKGHDVHVFERHSQPGGRARQFRTEEGFVFDMGPSWYWMPDIMEEFFKDFGHQVNDFFELISLNPQFDLIFSDECVSIPESYADLRVLFERMEPGAGDRLDQFMKSAKFKYEVGMQDFVRKPCHHWGEFLSLKIAKNAIKLDLLSDFRSYVNRYFKNPKLRSIMEFPVIFLGASPKQIPALYSLMNYGGYALGTHYPIGGFHQLVHAMQRVAEGEGAKFHFNQEINKIQIEQKRARALQINGQWMEFDSVITSADYHHSERMLPESYRNYDESYWKKRVFAPSCLIFYLGIDGEIPHLTHHSLFFEHDLDRHIDSIYTERKWPEEPLFYACCPSKTDSGVAPAGKENLFLLMPVAIGLQDDETIRESYLIQMLKRLEKRTGTENLNDRIVFKRSYSVRDFVTDYHAYGGNAYGLANTLGQTAVSKPKIRNKKIENLFYTGQLTVPGPGVPPAIISGKIVANEVDKMKGL